MPPKRGKRNYETFLKNLEQGSEKSKAYNKCLKKYFCIDFTAHASREEYWKALENREILHIELNTWKSFEVQMENKHWFIYPGFSLGSEWDRFERYCERIGNCTTGWRMDKLPE